MATRLANRIVLRLIELSVIEEGDAELYIYGFFIVISRLFFFLVTISAGLLAGVPVESILFYIVFLTLRSYAGGVHARTERSCTVLTTLALLVSVLLIKLFEMHTAGFVPLLMLGIGSLCILLISPLDSDEKPLNRNEKRKYKTICLVSLMLCLIVALIAWVYLISSVFYPLVCGIFLESILLVIGKIRSHRKNGIIFSASDKRT